MTTGVTIDLTSTSGVIEFTVVIAGLLIVAMLIVRFTGRDRSVRVARLGMFIERERFSDGDPTGAASPGPPDDAPAAASAPPSATPRADDGDA